MTRKPHPPSPPDTGAVVNFSDNWERLVGPLTGEVRAIIQGLLNLPYDSHEARLSYKNNHPSFQDDPGRMRSSALRQRVDCITVSWNSAQPTTPLLRGRSQTPCG